MTGQLGYHAGPEVDLQKIYIYKKSEMEDTTTRECYSSNSSAYVTCQPTHVVYATHKRGATEH